jgi:hypothetical protein
MTIHLFGTAALIAAILAAYVTILVWVLVFSPQVLVVQV